MAQIPVMRLADDARDIARQLITDYHQHLLTANMVYVFTDQKRKRCDRVRLGSAAKMNSLQRFLASGFDGVEHGPDFLILIDSNEWNDLGTHQRRALVDHELMHCTMFVRSLAPQAPWVRIDQCMELLPVDENNYEWRWGLRAHDLEEFAGVLKRYGFWRADPAETEFREIALQLVMPQLAEPPTNGTTQRTKRTKEAAQ